jgi:hypothetical protein
MNSAHRSDFRTGKQHRSEKSSCWDAKGAHEILRSEYRATDSSGTLLFEEGK